MTASQLSSVLGELCEALRKVDADILDIVQFGSSVYAPDLAKDVDLVVTTKAKKDDALYWDAVANVPVGVDVLVREPGQQMGADIALSVCATGTVLFGDGKTLEEAKEFMPVPSYDEARNWLVLADEDLQAAFSDGREWFQDKKIRSAFDALFDGARYAAMCYLATENNRWGELRRMLPQQFSDRFRIIINTLHIQYWYEGRYPKDRVDEEFQRWRAEVAKFIQDLEQARQP